MATFMVGDVLRFHRGEYSHVALYAGNNRVIHLWSPSSSREFSVRIDSIRHIQNSSQSASLDEADYEDDTSEPERCTEQFDAKMMRDHRSPPYDGEEVIRRARTRLGETRYDYLGYNCEHFVTWARYGVEASPQARSHTNQVIAGALLGAAVAGIAGLVVGGAISFFSKVNALSASSSGVAEDTTESTSDFEDATEEVQEEVEVISPTSVRRGRREERQRLLEEFSTMRIDDDGSLSEFEAWAEARHQSRMQATARRYSDVRHDALATRLADENLLCGICFYDLQLTRVVAFPCDHLTCAKCFEALVPTAEGQKNCPYCRYMWHPRMRERSLTMLEPVSPFRAFRLSTDRRNSQPKAAFLLSRRSINAVTEALLLECMASFPSNIYE